MHDIFTVYKAVVQPGTIRTRKDGSRWVKTSSMKWIPYKEGQQRAQPKPSPSKGAPTAFERKAARGKAERETTGSTARAKLQAKMAEGKGKVGEAQEAVRTAKVAAAKARAARAKGNKPGAASPEVKQGAENAKKIIEHVKKNPKAMADLKKTSGRTHQSDAEVLAALGGLLKTMKPGDITESVMGYLKSGASAAGHGGMPINPLGMGGPFGSPAVSIMAGGMPVASVGR